jgi:hypothetical protein
MGGGGGNNVARNKKRDGLVAQHKCAQ